MKLRQVKSSGVLSEEARQRLEEIFFHDLDSATRVLQEHFPYHVVHQKGDLLHVSNNDGSINVAVFRDANAPKPELVETHFGLRRYRRLSSPYFKPRRCAL